MAGNPNAPKTHAKLRFGSKQGNLVNMTELVDLFGSTQPTISSWIKKGMPFLEGGAKGTPYKFDSAACILWRIQYEASSMREELGGSNKMEIDEARRRKEVAQAVMAELLLEKEQGTLANIDDLMGNFSSALVRVRSKLSSMPSRVSGLVSFMDAKEIQTKLDAEITSILEELSDYQHEYTDE